MKLKFKGFLIKSVDYKLKRPLKPGKVVSDLSISNGEISLSGGDHPTVIVHTNAQAYSKNKGEKEETQVLSVGVDFIFDIDAEGKTIPPASDDSFRKLLETYAMNYCITRVEELIKQLTSLDYGRPIVIQRVTMPSGVNLTEPDPESDDAKG